MRIISILRTLLILLIILILASGIFALAASNSIPPTSAGTDTVALNPDDIKPAECNSITLTELVQGSGTITGTTGNDLILGSGGNDMIDGLGGDDCILGGDGDDTIDGNDQTDICLGGQGTDTFSNCESAVQ